MLHRGPAQVTEPTKYSIEFSNRCLVLAFHSNVPLLCVPQTDHFSVRLTTLMLNIFVNAVVYIQFN